MQALQRAVYYKMPIVSISKGFRSLLKQNKVKPIEAKEKNLNFITSSNNKGLLIICPIDKQTGKILFRSGYSKHEYFNGGKRV